MRRWRGVLAVVLTALAWAASAVAQVPQRGGELRFAVLGEPASYDCHASGSYPLLHVLRPHYSTLLKFRTGDYPTITGDLADSWTVSADGLEYTFRLRRNVKFHDGTPLTAEDVRATFERIRKPPPGVRSVREEHYAHVAAIETPDAHTVVFRLARAVPAMLVNFASPWNCVYSAARLQEDPRYPERNVMGTGPFEFVEHVPGSHWTGRRFADYHEAGKPYLDAYRAVFTRGPALIEALASGELHGEFRGLAPPERDRVVQARGDAVAVHSSPWVCGLFVTFNTRKPPFDDVRVRRALSLAIDRHAAALALGRTTIARDVGGLLRPGAEYAATPAELRELPGFGPDAAARAAARRLLIAAGHPDLAFTLINRDFQSPYAAAAEFLVEQWREVGADVRHAPLEMKAYLAAKQGEPPAFDAALDFACDYADEPNLQLQRWLSYDRSSVNQSGHVDRPLDILYERQEAEADRARRAVLVRQFERRALNRAYSVPVLWWHREVVLDRRVRGWHISPSHYLGQELADVWLGR
jgi:peptide/nickel transport system substrate-binding protein